MLNPTELGEYKMALEYREAEIERLRAALQKIADLTDSEADEPLDDAIQIAQKALSTK